MNSPKTLNLYIEEKINQVKSGILLNESLEVKDQVIDVYGDEIYKEMALIKDGKIVGCISYSVYNNQPSIQMIKVADDEKRKGYGTKLIKQLQLEYPNQEINFGWMTDEGSALYKSLPKNIETNTEYQNIEQKLDKSNKRLKKYSDILDKVTGEETGEEQEKVLKTADFWNKEYKKNQKYVNWLSNNKKHKEYIDVSDFNLDEMAYPASWNLETFKSLHSFKARIDYCKEHLEPISSGSSRWVFKVDDDKVLKIAKNTKGIAQNKAEIDMKDEIFAQILAPIYDCDDESYLWLEMALARKCNKKEFEAITHIPFDLFCSGLRNTYEGNRTYFYSREDLDKFNDLINNDPEASEFWSDVQDYVGNYDIPTGDLTSLRNWGIVDGNVVIIDYGFTKDVATQYYHGRY